jgi:hypothetical protein
MKVRRKEYFQKSSIKNRIVLMKQYLIPILDEQTSVGFTGKVNILDEENSKHLGAVYIFEGEIFDVNYNEVNGLKAFYNLCIDEFDHVFELKYIVEPELVNKEQIIKYPFSVLKRKAAEIVTNFKEYRAQRPPKNLKLMVEPTFINAGEEINEEEYSLLCTLSDYNLVEDLYKHSPLLDYEITMALVSLRKKNALRVIKKRTV